MAALDGSPGVALGDPQGILLGRMPTNGRGVEQDAGPLQSGDSSGFRIPLIPTDQGCDAADGSIASTKPQVARGEIKFLVVGGIVGDMHLAVEARDLAAGVNDRRAI